MSWLERLRGQFCPAHAVHVALVTSPLAATVAMTAASRNHLSRRCGRPWPVEVLRLRCNFLIPVSAMPGFNLLLHLCCYRFLHNEENQSFWEPAFTCVNLHGVIVRSCKDVVGFTEFNSSEVVCCAGAIGGVFWRDVAMTTPAGVRRWVCAIMATMPTATGEVRVVRQWRHPFMILVAFLVRYSGF
jgi:hypothetical protein